MRALIHLACPYLSLLRVLFLGELSCWKKMYAKNVKYLTEWIDIGIDNGWAFNWKMHSVSVFAFHYCSTAIRFILYRFFSFNICSSLTDIIGQCDWIATVIITPCHHIQYIKVQILIVNWINRMVNFTVHMNNKSFGLEFAFHHHSLFSPFAFVRHSFVSLVTNRVR